MGQPISTKHPMVRQSNDIAGEVCRLIACRAMEGADVPAIASGLALALNRVAKTGPEGAALRSIVATLLAEHVAA
ncbi:MAG: hypothetical protein WAP03_21910 [Methylorubrum rhodinum]|uniref:hypothetical protein n=1 Tax=Methylorubrum rhodinum TaxID=29428 RepID=UPI003BB20D73